jgi:hypothetical protein
MDLKELNCFYCKTSHSNAAIILKKYSNDRIRVRCRCNNEYIIGIGKLVIRDENSKNITNIKKEVIKNGKDGKKKENNT